jgi:hypothetical protein
VNVSIRNHEGYHDPTAYEAMLAVTRAELRELRPYRPLVYICSPFAGDVERNIENAKRFCRFAVKQGAIPLAPHLHYPQFLDDSDPDQRKDGLRFAIILLCKCDELWCFGNYYSEGMKRELDKARKKGIPIRFFTSDCEVAT